ncbi:MAG: hypothetical protein ACI83O_000143 [Patescibacteria group bacterium]|jgi:hypothetical protein
MLRSDFFANFEIGRYLTSGYCAKLLGIGAEKANVLFDSESIGYYRVPRSIYKRSTYSFLDDFAREHDADRLSEVEDTIENYPLESLVEYQIRRKMREKLFD